MTQEQYNQFYKDFEVVINNQKLICKKLDLLQSDVETAINNTQILERIIDDSSKKKISKLNSILDEIKSIYMLLKR